MMDPHRDVVYAQLVATVTEINNPNLSFVQSGYGYTLVLTDDFGNYSSSFTFFKNEIIGVTHSHIIDVAFTMINHYNQFVALSIVADVGKHVNHLPTAVLLSAREKAELAEERERIWQNS